MMTQVLHHLAGDLQAADSSPSSSEAAVWYITQRMPHVRSKHVTLNLTSLCLHCNLKVNSVALAT